MQSRPSGRWAAFAVVAALLGCGTEGPSGPARPGAEAPADPRDPMVEVPPHEPPAADPRDPMVEVPPHEPPAAAPLALPVVELPGITSCACPDDVCAGMPRITLSTAGTRLGEERLVVTDDGVHLLRSELDRAVLDARGPEFREWYAHASAGGRMSYWLDLRVATDVTNCDVETLLALSGRDHAVAAVQGPHGEPLRVGFVFGTALPTTRQPRDLLLRIALTQTTITMQSRSGAPEQTTPMDLQAAVERAWQAASARGQSVYVVVSAEPGVPWAQVVRILAAAGPMILRVAPSRVPTLLLHSRTPTEGQCRALTAP